MDTSDAGAGARTGAGDQSAGNWLSSTPDDPEVPETDAGEAAVPFERPVDDPEVPEADALDQATAVPFEDDDAHRP